MRYRLLVVLFSVVSLPIVASVGHRVFRWADAVLFFPDTAGLVDLLEANSDQPSAIDTLSLFSFGPEFSSHVLVSEEGTKFGCSVFRSRFEVVELYFVNGQVYAARHVAGGRQNIDRWLFADQRLLHKYLDLHLAGR